MILGSFSIRFDDSVLDQPTLHTVLIPSRRDCVRSLVVVGSDEVLEFVSLHFGSFGVVGSLLLDDPSSKFRIRPRVPEVRRSIVV